MLKASDLMVNDWVQASHEFYEPYSIELVPGQIRHINCDTVHLKDGSIFYGPQDDGTYYVNRKYEILEPIPLSEEIMRSNGFYFKEADLYMGHHWRAGVVWTHDSMNKDQEVNFNSSFSVLLPQGNIPLKYVHELQHALRLCGLSELADNFKIK